MNVCMRNKYILEGLLIIPKVMGISALVGISQGFIRGKLEDLPQLSGEDRKYVLSYINILKNMYILVLIGKGCNSLFIAKQFHYRILSG